MLKEMNRNHKEQNHSSQLIDKYHTSIAPENGLWGPFDDGYYPDEENDDLINKDKEKEHSTPPRNKDENKKPPTNKKRGKDTPLAMFGNDLTALAAEGKLDPMVGRERELQRLMHILCRRRKNNPVLIGEPGVGKSAVVEGLAQRIVNQDVPVALMNKRIISLDTALLVAGTKYRGEFEQRLKSVMDELKSSPDVILFIDEIHSIIGTGGAEGSLDMSNIMKPALSRGEIRCIGSTTLSEYSKTIERDGALERRFQKVILEPNTAEETINILSTIKKQYEEFHNVTYTDDAIKTAVELTDRYINDRFFPDKAIDAIDEAGAGASMESITRPEEIDTLKNEIELYRQKRLDAANDQNYELAASWRNKERETQEQLDDLLNELTNKKVVACVDSDVIAKVIGTMTGIPTERLAKTEAARLRDLQKILSKEIVGQDEAVRKVSKAIQRNRLGLRDNKRPIGTFLFLGPTGVGKTYLAKKLTEELFGDENALIRIDMSEYSERISTTRLVGAAPGYVGYEEGGQLTEKVRRKPYSVVLLDEIEKAHPDVFNIFLQVLDEGAITDSMGRKVDFKNTVIILTGNVGSRKLSEFGTGMGFRRAQDDERDDELARSLIDKELRKTFSPEFLNRLDGVIHFNSLSKEDIRRIVDLRVEELTERINKLGFKLLIPDEVRDFISNKSYDPAFGARPINRMIQVEIEERVTDMFLDAELEPNSVVVFSVKDDELHCAKADEDATVTNSNVQTN